MGAWKEIVDFTWVANETSRTFSGLNITKDDFIKIVFTATNPTSSSQYNLFVNGNTTNSNYWFQFVNAVGTSLSGNRVNASRPFYCNGGTSSINTAYVKISENNRANYFAQRTDEISSNVNLIYLYHTTTFDVSSITSFTLNAETSNAIGTGSRIQIYRLDAEKVADITTTANATQVDISSLSIGKDSEYLLVGEFPPSSIAPGNDLSLFVNDNTTSADYNAQWILGSDSTASALRVNSAIFGTNSNNRRELMYAHIKVSEIGAFTAQLYCMQAYGTTAPILRNVFLSTTAENISSVTKINLKGGTNQIVSGSRFLLYKLK